MKYRDENGNFQEIYLESAGDTLPIGAIVEFDGDETPTNWERIEGTSKIKKVRQAIGLIGNIVDSLDSTGENDVPNTKTVKTAIQQAVEIVESGSNEYGDYIKFSDGSMICRGQFEVPGGTASVLVTLPRNFLASDTYTTVCNNRYSYSKLIFIGAINQSGYSFKVFPVDFRREANNFVPNETTTGNYIAMGKWK